MVLDPFWPPFWSPFGVILRILGFRKVSQKRLENKTAKIPKLVPKLLPEGFKLLTLLGSLGGLVDHLGPEAPHIGPKGSKMSQNVPKTIKNRPQINKKHINTRIQNGSQNLAATRFPAHLPLHRPLGPGAAVSCRRLLNIQFGIRPDIRP